MAQGTGTRPWKRGTEAKRATVTDVVPNGDIIATDEGNLYVGNGSRPTNALSRSARMTDVAELSALEYGVTTTSADCSVEMQAAIDAAAASKKRLFIPRGDYRCAGLVLRGGVKVRGEGKEQSVLKPPAAATASSILGIPEGVVQDTVVEDLGFVADNTAVQHGILIHARRGTSGQNASGLWHSAFRNVRVYNFPGAQMWFRGGGTDSLDPIQFIEFVGMVLERRNNSAQSIALLFSGQVNQTTWSGGRADAFGASAAQAPGVNIKMCRELSAYDVTFDGSTTYASNKAGHTHIFHGFSTQQAELGVYLDGMQNVEFFGIHVEGTSNGIHATNASLGILIVSPHFANSALGTGNPYSVRASAAATVTMLNPIPNGSTGRLSDTDGATASVDVMMSASTAGVVTNGLTRQMTPAATLNTGKARTVVLNASATAIATVSSALLPNERLTFKALGSCYLGSGGNIGFPSQIASPLEIPQGSSVTLVRMDKSDTWHIETMPVQKGYDPKPARWTAGWGTSVGQAALVADRLSGSRLPIGRACTLSQIACEVTAAGSAGAVIRLAIYQLHPVTQVPTLLVDAGTVDATTIGVKTLAISLAVPKDAQLMLMGAIQGGATTGPTVRTVGGHDPFLSMDTAELISSLAGVGFQMPGVSGAAPSTASYGLSGSTMRILVSAA